ncbi:MAG: hypothetical protein WCL44_04860 [bacterium]
MHSIAWGELPGRVELPTGGSDLAELETCFNRIIEQMKMRIATIESQQMAIVEAEQQKVMIESLCTACHHFGQPATAVGLYLELLKKEKLSQEGTECLGKCMEAMDLMRDILGRLSRMSTYKSRSYLSSWREGIGEVNMLDVGAGSDDVQ